MSRRVGRRAVLAAAGTLIAAPGIVRAQAPGSGVALVIGNSKYQWEAQLPNVRRDAPDIAKALQAMGLRTELVQDVGRDAMRAAVEKFAAATRGASLAAFYFAGHGASWEKDTYLVPIDTDLGNPSVVQTLLPVPSVSTGIRGAAHRLLVFDNCRNNPSDGWRQLAAERAAGVNPEKLRAAGADADPDALTLYSTAPGRVALDGPPGQNSPFAAALLRQLGTAAVDLQAVAPRLRRELLIATGGRQVLWDQNTYGQPFQLKGSGQFPAAAGGTPAGYIEVPNAYAFARDKGLPLPEGLIAYRSPAGSPHAQKIGAFTFTNQTSIGPAPYLFVVLSVDEQGTAQIIISVQNDSGRLWRFVTGSASGNRLSFVPNWGRPAYHVDWSDANSGTVGSLAADNAKNTAAARNTVRSLRFTRLDG
jgi:hypothetical protein